MLDKIAKHFDFQQRSLNLRSYRAEVLASNIANNETPYYKAMDFDFTQALKSQVDSQGRLAMQATDERHFSNNDRGNGLRAQLQYRTAVQPSLDGNTVDMDVERAAFADNAIKFQSTLTFLNKRISGLNTAIQGQGGN
ncbi:flagellar basal body rod protein FlgB [Neisseriaceae bacterium TC5R-5]|nr:flagellar basal body rod protein FlgB [Neisseriaceae bacterium TC5R-5]